MLSRAVFFGSKSLGLAVFKALLAASDGIRWSVIHPDDHADQRSCLEDFRQFAQASGCEFVQTESAGQARQVLADLNPDIGFVCGWYCLLDGETLAKVPHGLWGIHNSLLPQYRGGAPLVWSIINGDEVVGSSVFRISDGMDDGPILHQVRVACGADAGIGEILSVIESRLVQELPHKWRELLTGDARPVQQDRAQATYCGQRTEFDGLVQWTWPAQRVHNFIRAQSPPYPCAFSYLGQEQVRFLATRVRPETYFGTPGQILMRTGGSVLVSCGANTALEVLSVSTGVDKMERKVGDVIRSVKWRFIDGATA